jgi:DNA-binding NtrC family response regulator
MTLIAHSRVMREALGQACRYAAVDATVLITGETGSGKNAFAHFLHESGSRSRHPFVTVDCPGLPATLVESELFGHERGAFTDATSARPGRFEAAGRGTIYLDLVSALTPAAQGALLRVVDERRAVRLGGTTVIGVHARLIASAQGDLGDAVDAGTFRPDLYHRLRVLTLAVPPLRERRDDILPLSTAFVGAIALELRRPPPAIAPAAADALIRYPWPGNVRELRHTLERALIGSGVGTGAVSGRGGITGAGDVIDVASLPIDVLEGGDAYLGASGPARPTLDDVTRRYIELTLKHVHGSQTRAAAILGISRKALWEKRRRYGMD